MDIPKSQIRSLVGRYHVGTSDSTIRAEIRNRTMSPTTGQLMKGWTPSLVRKAEDYAIKIHRANQALYGYVMSGASMRNPGGGGGVGIERYISPGDRVTIVDRFGKQHTGRAVMRGPHGWVLNMGGRYGTPAVATDETIVKVYKKGRR